MSIFIQRCANLFLSVCFISLLAACATTGTSDVPLTQAEIDRFVSERVDGGPPQSMMVSITGNDLIADMLPLELMPYEESVSIPIFAYGDDKILSRREESLDDRCKGIHEIREESNRRLARDGLRSRGPIEADVSYVSRPTGQNHKFLRVSESDNISFIGDVAAFYGGVSVKAVKVYLMLEKIGPVHDLIRVERFPPVEGGAGAVVSAAFSPLMLTMNEEERREYMLQFGCTTETRVAQILPVGEGVSTGRVALGELPAQKEIMIFGLDNVFELVTDENGLAWKYFRETAFIPEPKDLSHVDFDSRCIDCGAAGIFHDLALGSLLERSVQLDLEEAYHTAQYVATASAFSQRISRQQFQELERFDLQHFEMIEPKIQSMITSGYAADADFDTFIIYLEDLTRATESGRSAIQYRDEREAGQRLVEEEARREAQDRQRQIRLARQAEEERFAREYPYVIRLYCRIHGNQVPFFQCLYDSSGRHSEFLIREGNRSRRFSFHEFVANSNQIGAERPDGFYIDLPRNFEINTRNARRGAILGYELLMRGVDSPIAQDEVGLGTNIFIRP
ncbi:MAG: hypothetical protein ACXIUB_03520 [Wenzhouxiangella sp.]